MAAYEVLLLNTAIPQIQAAQSGDTYLCPRELAVVVNTATDAVRITQTGTGNALLVEDSANPDSSPFVVTATGDVGIGTTSPVASTPLTLQTASGYTDILWLKAVGTNVDSRINIAPTGTGLAQINNTAGTAIALQISGAEQMRLTTTGLGVGTNNPGQKLDVNGSGLFTVSGANSSILLNTSNNAQNYNGLINFQRQGSVKFYAALDANDSLAFLNSSAVNLLTITSSGNLGLGVTPSAWSGAGKIIQFGNGNASIGTQNNGDANFLHNAYESPAGTFKYVSSNPALRYQLDINNNAHKWYNAPSGTANSAVVAASTSYTVVALGTTTLGEWQASFNDASNNPLTVTPTLGQVLTSLSSPVSPIPNGGLVTQNIAFTQAMTLDASGNLGVGETNPASRLHVTVSGSTEVARFETTTNNTPSVGIYSDGGIRGKLRASTAEMAVLSQGSIPLLLGVNDAEKARITSGGDLYVGTQTDLAGNTAKLQSDQQTASRGAIVAKNITSASDNIVSWNAATSGDNIFVGFYTETAITSRGSITYNRTGGLVAYNTTSDYRAKDILGPVANSGATIDALKVYEGVMKGATQSRPMLIAHEAQDHAPYAVTGEKDAVNEDGTPKYQQMDVSSLVPLLLAEIQSLRARVAQLEQGA